MKKPHEQEWRQYRSGNDNHGVTNEGHGVIATRITDYDTAMLVAAAPDMARALMALGGIGRVGDWHTSNCLETHEDEPCLSECMLARAALRKAGVLP